MNEPNTDAVLARQAVAASVQCWLDKLPGALTVVVQQDGRDLARLEAPALVSPDTEPEDECVRAIRRTLEEVGHRLTTDGVLEEMQRRGHETGERTWSDGWIKQMLAEAIDKGWLDNDQRARPFKGYGLPEWPRAGG